MADVNVGTARVDIVVDTTGYEAGLKRAQNASKTFSAEATQAIDGMTRRQQQMVRGLQQQTATLGLTRQEMLAYSITTKTTGKVQEDLLKALKANTSELTKEAVAMDKTGMSAKQLNAALRGVPAQLTDIVVGLQGGQAPLTVLLQQGGQLRDMFGSAGGAVRALASTLRGLITPVTVIGGALALMAVSFLKGEQESRGFNTALLTTGNVAGKTAQDLADLSVEIDNLRGSTQSSGAAAVTEVAQRGKFLAGQIGTVAKAAEQMRVATGKAISDTVDEFAQLADDPVKAIQKLNEAQHFLTLETYEQIKALQDQGREQEAATLAMNTYADAISQRTGQIEENLGTLQHAWRGVKMIASEAWDAMLDIGRESSPREKFNELSKQLAELQDTSNPFSFLHLSAAERQKRIEQVRKEMRELSDANVAAIKDANKRQVAQEAEEAAIALDQQAAIYRTNEQKRVAEKTKAKGEADAAYIKAMAAGNLKTAEKIRADEAAILAGIDAKYDAKQKKDRADKVDPGVAILRSLRDQIAVNKEAVEVKRALTASESLYEKTLVDLLDPTKQMSAAVREQIKVALEQLKVSGDNAAAAQREAKAKEQLARLEAQLTVQKKNAADQNAADIAAMSRGGEEVERMQRRIKIEQEYAKEVARLRDQGIAETDASYIAQEERLRQHRDEMLVIEDSYWADRQATMNDWKGGAVKAFEDFSAQARNLAGSTAELLGSAFDNLTDAVVDFAMTGKLSLEQFAEDFARMAIKIVTNRALMELINYILPALSGSGGAMSTNVSGADANVRYGAYAAKGAVWSSPSLSAMSGSVLYGATSFPMKFAKGGVMGTGTAGEVVGQPEAIMPLAKTSGGKLGVEVAGGMMGPQVVINIENNTSSEAKVEESRGQDGTKFFKIIIDAAANEVDRRIATMGSTGKAISSRFSVNPTGTRRG